MDSATPPASAEKPLATHQDGPPDNSNHNRGHAIEHIGSKADRTAKPVAAKLCQVDARSHSEWHSNQTGDAQINIEPTIALAMPPPASPTGLGFG